MTNKRKSALRSLISIPIVMIFDIVVFAVSAFIDTHMLPNLEEGGHPAPAMTIIAIIMIIIITTIVVISSIATAISRAIQNRKTKNSQEHDPEGRN